MSDKQTDGEQTGEQTGSLVPIEVIEPPKDAAEGPIIPQALSDDPVSGDGSVGREGVDVSSWRLNTLESDRLRSLTEPSGDDRKSRRRRRVHEQSRNARTEQGRKRRRIGRVVVGLLLAATIAACAAVAGSYVMEMWGGKTIPSVMGLSQGNAIALVEQKGFKVTTETVPADGVDGHVVGVDPPEGKRVDEKTEVHLKIGVKRTIPEVVGKKRDEARTILEQAGAQNVRFETQDTHDEEDMVLEVRPGAGSEFMSSEEIVVVVSQLPRMPKVVGEEEEIALTHLKREGISATSEFEQASADKRMRVVRSVPAEGEVVPEEGAKVYVGDPLSEVIRLDDYYDAKAPHIKEFLESKGYEARVGYTVQNGQVVAGFANGDNVSIGFVPEPWKHNLNLTQGSYSEVMTDDARITGIRMVIPGAAATSLGIKDPSVSDTTAKEIAKLCGFGDRIADCTQANITLPKGTNNVGHSFYCCYGETSRSTWTIFIKGTTESSGKLAVSEIVIGCGLKSAYASNDLAAYGDSICNFVAYNEEYV